MSLAKRADTNRKVELWIEQEDGSRRKLSLNPVILGSRKQVWAVFTTNGNSYDAPAANWTFPSNVQFVSDFNPTRAAGIPEPVDTQGPNPVNFVPWSILNGQPGLPPTQTVVTLQCEAQDLDGQWYPIQDDFTITFPAMTLGTVIIQQSNVPVVENSQMGPSWLNYGQSWLKTDFEYTGLPGGAQLALIQTVDTIRDYTLADGSTQAIANTNGAYLLDASPKTLEVFYGGPITDPGDNDFPFEDFPQQPIPGTFLDQNVEASFASDQFFLYLMYKTTVGGYDPNNLWTPVALFTWGWYGRAVLGDDDDTFELDAGNSSVLPFNVTSMTALSWSASISDTIIQPNGPPDSSTGRRTKSKIPPSRQNQ